MNNQREIKFRAWDKEKKRWVIFTAIEFKHEKVFLRDGFGNYIDGDFEIVEFTGLKDKNGKEIWESDLIKYQEKIWEVRWVCAGFWLVIPEESKDIELTPTKIQFMEVVGNKYENINKIASD